VDIPLAIKFTTDGGTIVAGYTDSKDGDISTQPNREYWDLWVIKLNKCGIIEWERSFGGSNYESARDVVQTADGGYIVAGETNSTDGGVVAGYGGTKDIWVLRLDPNGNLLWQKRYGGTGLDIANRIYLQADGSFYLLASSSSNDGNISGNHGAGGYTDGVVMKLDAAGTIQWSRCYGGSKNEELLGMEIINGRTYLAGYANSTDGDIPPNQKNYDVWLLALDANGNKVYSKVYGGSQNDVAYSMTKGLDGTITLAGYTTSDDEDVSGAMGSQDYWVINITPSNGKLNWQKVLGGSDADYANSIITDNDGGYIAAGISYSDDGDITNPLGDGDYWVVKLDATGSVLWKQNIGGGGNDHLRSILLQPSVREYFLCGDSDSGDGDFNNNLGETDFGIIKLKQLDTLLLDSTVCSINGFSAPPDTLRDVCGNDSAYVTYQPVLLQGPFQNIKNIDTIFEGNTLVLPSNDSANNTITWNADPTLSCTACSNPVASPMTTTIYTATSSLDDCSIEGQFTLVVLKDALVNLPTAFTPNGDGLNDYFGALGKVPGEFLLQIYNRNGEMVFKSTDTYDRWDGRFNGKLQPPGVFVFWVQYKDMQNRMWQRKGTLALIR
jgi:gliding motility-associated-like protein